MYFSAAHANLPLLIDANGQCELVHVLDVFRMPIRLGSYNNPRMSLPEGHVDVLVTSHDLQPELLATEYILNPA